MNSMSKTPKLKLFLALILAFGATSLYCLQEARCDDSEFSESAQPVDKVAAISYVTWWSHDNTGYHPSILLKLENYSGKDLTGQLIRFQARFTDLTNGIVTVARREVRQAFVPHQQIYVLLKGPQPFDLPIEDYNWPIIECKVMCRVGSVDDAGTQSVVVAKLESITMNDDDAMQKMSRMADFSRTAARNADNNNNNNKKKVEADAKPPKPTKPEKPLVAHAGKLEPAHNPEGPKPKTQASSAFEFLTTRTMPGLGDDFYIFERTFGLPTETSTSESGWTWASYKHEQPSMTMLAGSRGRTGKVDMIILALPERELEKESSLVSAVKALSGPFKNQKIAPPTHSVRYLSSGRMQLLTCTAPGYHSAYFTAASRAQDGNQSYLVLSRVPGNVVDMILEHAKHANLVQPVAQVLGGS
jgi:hypothetical protein